MKINLIDIMEEFNFLFPKVDIGVKPIVDMLELASMAIIELSNLNTLVENGFLSGNRISPTLENIYDVTLDLGMDDSIFNKYLLSICVRHIPESMFNNTDGIMYLIKFREVHNVLEVIIK